MKRDGVSHDVAMTRAIEQLILTSDRSSEFTSRLEAVLGKVV
ncbi:MAG: hypothetical protein V7L26_24915 [Nostoc sp.]